MSPREAADTSGQQQQQQQQDFEVPGISRKYPTYRKSRFVSNESWLKGKRADDEAEGLWRIHDMLYDFTDFVDRHPGGAFWLQRTKGTDITEPFECHHISRLPEMLLNQYKVRTASKPRNYKLTFHANGFYKVLQSRVCELLKNIDNTPAQRSDKLHLGLLLSTLAFSVASAHSSSLLITSAAALSLCWLSIASHNYFHRKDNWRMYTFNLTLMNFANWRISHALSHHIYTNSLHDLEMSMFEPFLCWVPNIRYASTLQRCVSLIIQPIVYPLVFPIQFLLRVFHSVAVTNILYWHDCIGFALPVIMLAVSSQSVAFVLWQWFIILLLSSFLFGVIGLNAAHHAPAIHHAGDADRADRDWGLFQLDTTVERSDITSSHFLVLTHFGDHVLHHMFPTLDHGVLPQLRPVLLQTLQEFSTDARKYTGIQHFIGQNQQLLRVQPNPVPPGSKKDL